LIQILTVFSPLFSPLFYFSCLSPLNRSPHPSYPDEVASTPSPPADVLGTNDKSSVEYELVKQMAAKEGRESEEDGEGTEA
jgi:hypothetical protein